MALDITERARRLMAHCPPAISGQGGHSSTYRVACALVHGFGLSPEQAMPLMQEYNATCAPPWREYDLWHKLRSALQVGGDKPRGHLLEKQDADLSSLPAYAAPARKEAVKFDLAALQGLQEPGLVVDEAWLRARSPVDPKDVLPGGVIDGVFAPEDKVMVFGSMNSRGDWMRWRGGWFALGKTPDTKAQRITGVPPGTDEGMVFLIQPVDGLWHPKAGDVALSRRTQRSITRHAHILLESDEAPAALWLNVLVRQRLPIVAMSTSGGRSIHALVRCGASTKDEWLECVEQVRDTMAAIGCDTQALANPMVNMRLGNTIRRGKMTGGRDARKFVPFPHGNAMQRLLYLNPSPQMQAIAALPVLERAAPG